MDRTDEEQIEALRDWWRRNGSAVMLGVGLAAAGLTGWWGYGQWQEGKAQEAAAAYGLMIQAEREGAPLPELTIAARQVMEDHRRSGYAPMAAMRLGARQMEAGQYIAAARTLGWVVEHVRETAMVELARLRQARALAAAGRTEEALALVAQPASPGFVGAYADLRGDLLADMGRAEAAAEAYRDALRAEGLDPQTRRLVELKLGNLDAGV